MKCRYIRNQLEPRSFIIDSCREKLVEENGRFYWPAGTLEEHPNAWRLVQMGVAEPADEECRIRAGMTKEQMAAAQRAQKTLAFDEQDKEAAANDEIVGYDEDGDPIPGPNWQGD